MSEMNLTHRALAAGLLACAALFSSSVTAAESLSMWVRASGANAAQRLTDLWNTGHADKIALTVIPDNQVVSKLATGVKAGDVPDLVSFDLIYMPDFMRAGLLTDITDSMKADPNFGKVAKAFSDLATYKGRMFGTGFTPDVSIIIYNKDLFRKAGLDPNKPPTTWEELQAVAQKATLKNAQGQVTSWGLTIPDDIWLAMCFIYQNGGRVSSADFKKAYLGEKATIEAVQFWTDLANKYKVMPRHRTFPISVQDFAAGNTAMLIHSTGNLRFVSDSAKFEWGTAFLPTHKKQAVAIGGAGFYIFKKASKEKQEAAWQFIKFATSAEMQARWNIGSGYIATRKSSFELPIMKEYTAKLPQALVARDQIPYALPEMSTHDNWKMRNIFVTTFQEILDEKYTPEEGMKKAQAEIEKVLAPFQK